VFNPDFKNGPYIGFDQNFGGRGKPKYDMYEVVNEGPDNTDLLIDPKSAKRLMAQHSAWGAYMMLYRE
jgi:hypothetical protein